MSVSDSEKQQIGKCAFCGQTRYIQTIGEVSQAELDAMATEQCLCVEAQREKRRLAREKKVTEFIQKKFMTEKMIEYIRQTIKLIEDEKFEEFTIKLYKEKVCKIWLDNDKNLHIRIKKTEDDELKA